MGKLSNDDRYASESSLPQDLSPMLTRSGRSVDRNLLHGSSSSLDVKSDKKHKLAIRKPWRKKSRDQSDGMSASLEQSPTLSRKLQQNGVNNNAESVSNNSEEQDVDGMFKSYEEKSNANGEKKEYHGNNYWLCVHSYNIQLLMFFFHVFCCSCLGFFLGFFFRA